MEDNIKGDESIFTTRFWVFLESFVIFWTEMLENKKYIYRAIKPYRLFGQAFNKNCTSNQVFRCLPANPFPVKTAVTSHVDF